MQILKADVLADSDADADSDALADSDAGLKPLLDSDADAGPDDLLILVQMLKLTQMQMCLLRLTQRLMQIPLDDSDSDTETDVLADADSDTETDVLRWF